MQATPSPTGPIQTRVPAVRALASASARWCRSGLSALSALSSLDRGLCGICGSWAADVFCDACLHSWAGPRWRCGRCAIGLPEVMTRVVVRASAAVCADCRRSPPAFDAAWAALDYGPPWRRLISAFKFHAAPELARPLAGLMLRALPVDGAWRADAADVVLPVPLTAERWRERGYNQAWELARRLGPSLGLPVRDDLIERLVGGAHQAELSGEARQRQVRGAYAVPARARSALAGARVLLVDDVMTTGATLAECARVLRRAGARRVTVWALARTPAD